VDINYTVLILLANLAYVTIKQLLFLAWSNCPSHLVT